MFVGHERSYRGKTHRQCILCSVVVYCHLFLLNKKLTESLLRKGLNCLTPLYTCQTQGPRMNNKCISGPPMIWVANKSQQALPTFCTQKRQCIATHTHNPHSRPTHTQEPASVLYHTVTCGTDRIFNRTESLNVL